MFEEGKYKNFSSEKIKSSLEKEGYKPLLIKEDPNDFLESHKHPENHILAVVAGEMKVKTEGKEITMKPGDKLTIHSEVDHAAKFGPDGCKYFWIEY